jgi:hypothetical protein
MFTGMASSCFTPVIRSKYLIRHDKFARTTALFTGIVSAAIKISETGGHEDDPRFHPVINRSGGRHFLSKSGQATYTGTLVLFAPEWRRRIDLRLARPGRVQLLWYEEISPFRYDATCQCCSPVKAKVILTALNFHPSGVRTYSSL